jgi:hypothetical protein
MLSGNLIHVFKEKYGGLFYKGFSESDLARFDVRIPMSHPIFFPCLNDSTKSQLRLVNIGALEKHANRLELNEQAIDALKKLHNNSLLSDNEIQEKIISIRPYMGQLFDVWQDSHLKQLSLTSVGIAIGHANLKRHAGGFSDLAIWMEN